MQNDSNVEIVKAEISKKTEIHFKFETAMALDLENFSWNENLEMYEDLTTQLCWLTWLTWLTAIETTTLENDCMIEQTWFMKGTPVSSLIKYAENVYKAEAIAHQEWACEQGCTVNKPKHHKNIYAQSWNLQGKLVRELFEKYWTCQRGHLLIVWDNNTNDYVELNESFYKESANEKK